MKTRQLLPINEKKGENIEICQYLLKSIPDDVFHYIFEFLSLSILLKSISLVCKEWYTHIFNHPPHWNTLKLNYNPFYKKQDYQTFNKFCKKHNKILGTVKRLTIPEQEQLDIFCNPRNMLQYPHHLVYFTSLIQLNLEPYKLEHVRKLSILTNFTELNLVACDKLTNLDGISTLTKLKKIYLNECNSLSNCDPSRN